MTENKKLYIFYSIMSLIAILSIYFCNLYSKQIVDILNDVKSFGKEHQYIIQITEDLDVKFRKFYIQDGKIKME